MQYRFSAVALIALVGLANAQIPACATDCIADAVASATSCGADDLGCQCEESNQSAITTAATSCVIAACGDQAIAVLTAAQAACAAVSASAAGGASSTVASVSSAASSVVASASSVVASVSSAVESAASTYAPSTTAESSSIAYTTQAEPSVTIVPTPVPSSNATATATSPPIQVTNAAGQVVVGAGSLFAAGFAVLAAL
ncbi:hypothetical protein DL98DRAFT_586578 [Cadophora sp. DSE1049]|nr:hypothetical protein DL98DRAFT_586578 [Cadophora sp. DSE1049]